MRPAWIDEARRRLLELLRGAGNWSYRSETAPAVEPSSLAALALLATEHRDSDHAIALKTARWIATSRGPDGSTGVTSTFTDPGWTTPMAMLLWAALGGFEFERASARKWLLRAKGLAVRRVEHDPMGHDGMLVGWAWVQATHSWVEPTAHALLALGREGLAGHPRAFEGVRVLRDRAIPGGGWNAGNSVVFGTPLRPLPGPTGLALLALGAVDGPSKVVEAGIGWLRESLAGTLSPISLGWGTLGLRAWSADPDGLSERLACSAEKALAREGGPVELALLLLAVGDRSLEVLGVSPRHEVSTDA